MRNYFFAPTFQPQSLYSLISLPPRQPQCVTHETLTSLVAKLPYFNREDAAGLAVAVVKTFGHNGKSLNFDEWANLVREKNVPAL